MIGVAVTAAAGIAGAYLTRRSAKDNTAVDRFDRLTDRLEKRVDRLETQEKERNDRDVKHSVWDREIYSQARQAGWDVTPPPPLG